MKKPIRTEGGIQVIRRMDQLLEVLAVRDGPCPLAEIAAATGLHASTVHRILANLQALGYVDRPHAGHYCLGSRVLELAGRISRRLDLRQEALAEMEKLRDRTGESINLVVREGDEVVYLERIPGTASVRVEYTPGSRSPLHLNAAGKLFLAEGGFEACADYARRTRLPGTTPNAIRDLPRLYRELERALRTGYSLDSEETEIGVMCIAAPLRDASGRMRAALCLAAPTGRYRDTWIPHVLEAGRRVSRRLGWSRR
ncbi:MAG: IclR family transcriptional regulator [Aquisalimonadaceae bacterium]